jgi:Flp pilus assembly protein TadG
MKRALFMDLLRDRRGAAAAEMALAAPLLLTIMLGTTELGNYFWNEHTLLKAVRDGARFAARESFSNYTACSGSPGGTVVADTQNVVIYGYLSSTSKKLTPNISSSNVQVTTSCVTSTGGQTMTGLYKSQPTGAQIVIVSATVNYRPIIAAAFGFSGIGTHLNATSQAAVTGL